MTERDKERLFLACTGCSIALLLVTYGYMRTVGGFSEKLFVQQLVGWSLLVVGYNLGNRRLVNKWVLGGLVVVLLSSYIAVPLSVLGPNGTGYLVESLMTSVWLTPLIIYYFLDLKEAVFYWILPLLFVHAGLVIYQGIVIGVDRSRGLLHNDVPAGGVLAVGSVILMNTKYRWAVPFLLYALLHTGSRLALLAVVPVLIGMMVQKKLFPPLIPSIVSVVLLVGTVWATYDYLPQRFQIFGEDSSPGSPGRVGTGPIEQGLEDSEFRLEQTHPWNILPSGYVYTHGLHNMLQRVAVELGVGAAVVLGLVTIYGLVLRPYFSFAWWILLMVTLLSTLDYYMFLGAGAVLWWVSVGMRVREYAQRTSESKRIQEIPSKVIPV